jgi:uncharacterized protein YutE (UPF0331/DUF86 family)
MKKSEDIVTNKRIEEKITELDKYLQEFRQIEIPEFEDYQKDFKTKAVCERYFEKIIESIISLSIFFIRAKHLDSPENEDHIFFILSKNKILEEDFAKQLKDAKDMRNIIVHNYQKVEDVLVYNAIEEILMDAERFLEIIKRKA